MTLAHKANLQLLQASSLKWSAKPGVTIQLVVAADAQDNVYSRLHVPSRSMSKSCKQEQPQILTKHVWMRPPSQGLMGLRCAAGNACGGFTTIHAQVSYEDMARVMATEVSEAR